MPLARAVVKKALLAKGFVLEQGKRDHDFLILRHDGLTRAIFTKVSRGKAHRTIGDSLVARMGQQLQLTKQEFASLVACPLDADGYVALLKEREVLD